MSAPEARTPPTHFHGQGEHLPGVRVRVDRRLASAHARLAASEAELVAQLQSELGHSDAAADEALLTQAEAARLAVGLPADAAERLELLHHLAERLRTARADAART